MPAQPAATQKPEKTAFAAADAITPAGKTPAQPQ